MQTVEKVVEVPQVGPTMQGSTREVDIPLAPRREDPVLSLKCRERVDRSTQLKWWSRW